jgi:hypothetical protein
METLRPLNGATRSKGRLAQKAWLWLTASTVGMLGCQNSALFPDVPLFQAKKPLVGSQPHAATEPLALAEPDVPGCSPAALAQLPAAPEAIRVAKEPGQIATMPHPAWLDAVPAPAAVASQNVHEPNKTALLVSRNQTLLAMTKRLQGILGRDQDGDLFLLCPGHGAATSDRVKLLDYGPLRDMASGTAVVVTGRWDETASAGAHPAFHVQRIERLP